MRTAAALVLVLGLPCICFSADIYVPDHHAKIQDAIDVAVDGDTVIVRPGFYLENIDFAGKAIVVRSESGPSVTTIDGRQWGRVVTFQTWEGLDSVLEGFTVTNGKAEYGGGISCFNTSPTITGNTITGNTGCWDGGGIRCFGSSSSPIITNNNISGNTATSITSYLGKGGGVYCENSACPTIDNNTITENSGADGAGIYCDSSSPTITNNTIRGNCAIDPWGYSHGGGIYCIDTSFPLITGNTIMGNTAYSGGGIACFSPSSPIISDNVISGNTDGGIYCNGCSPTITGNVISCNSNYLGGGIMCYGASPTISDNIITQNRAHSGGGISCDECEPTITYNTIAGNTAESGGGGIHFTEASHLTNFTNNTISENRAEYGGGIYYVSRFLQDSLTMKDNFISGNAADISGGGIYVSWKTRTTITNNIISGNAADISGGGVYVYEESAATITINIISGNRSLSNGGGICCFEADLATLKNNTIYGNRADSDGGGIYLYKTSPAYVTNNTISGNTAGSGGGGIHSFDSALIYITNTILWNNTAPTGPEMLGGNPVVTYSNVKGGWTGEGNIDADPLFVDPAAGDFHIAFDSPCRSAGTRDAFFFPGTDFEGDPRIGLFALPDIGADEFHTHLYVNGTASNGSSATGVIIGWPKTNPVLLISGSGILPEPDPTPFGDFWLMPPWEHRIHFNAMPDNGVRFIDRVVSTGLPPGTQIPFQALVGTELSNLCVVTIE